MARDGRTGELAAAIERSVSVNLTSASGDSLLTWRPVTTTRRRHPAWTATPAVAQPEAAAPVGRRIHRPLRMSLP
jgi:hypothetical protein